MKTILLGDIHGRAFWKYIINTVSHDRVIFVGDYFDSFDINTQTQCNNFLDIIEYKKSSGKEVIMLIGNHDYHYLEGDNGTSGYQQVGKYLIEPLINENRNHLQMAYKFDNILCTHAGVSEEFMYDVFGESGWSLTSIVEQLNDLWTYKPKTFIFNGTNPYGDDTYQTPIWIRPKSLMVSSKNIKKEGIIQVVGHTQMDTIDIKGKSTGGKYFFIDTLHNKKGEYLIHENKKFELGKLNL